MAYEVVMPYHLHMPSYFLETFTEYPQEKAGREIRLFAFILYCLSGCNSHSFLYYP